MNINIKDITPICMEWLDTAVIPQAQPVLKAILIFTIAQAKDRINQKLITFFQMFADQDGNLDFDETFKNLNLALDGVSGKITLPYINWDFDKSDLEKIKGIALKRAQ